MKKRTRKYYGDYLSFVVMYCQDKGLEYYITVEPPSNMGYRYSIVIENVGFWNNIRIKLNRI